MRSFYFSLLILLNIFIFAAVPAFAGAKAWPHLFWGQRHWDTLNFQNRYIQDAKTPQNEQAEMNWSPQDWLADSNGDPTPVMEGFYRSGIITDQYIECSDRNFVERMLGKLGVSLSACNGTPVLEVGWPFMRLSDNEKIRIAAFVDYVYEISSQDENAMFEIYLKEKHIPIGVYTRSGLQLQ